MLVGLRVSSKLRQPFGHIQFAEQVGAGSEPGNEFEWFTPIPALDILDPCGEFLLESGVLRSRVLRWDNFEVDRQDAIVSAR